MANGAAAWPAGSGASGAAAHAAQQQEQQHSEPMLASRHNLTEEEKRLARMQRNRENAQLSRQRKKQQMAELEARCATLGQQNTKLTAAVQRLTAENAMLRQQLALICQQAGRNAAAAQKAGTAAKPGVAAAAAKPAKPATTSPPQPAAPAAVKPATAPAAEAAAAAVAARGLLPQWPLLPFGFLPKVARPGQLQAIRPGAAKPAPTQQRPAAPAQAASAAAAQRSAPAAQAGSAAVAPAGARAPKRARTAAGASTAFLALFTLFMFAGPLAPAPGTSSSAGSIASAGTGAQRSLQALPDAALLPSTDLELRHTGRGLQALPSAPSADPSGGQLQPAGGRNLQQLLNSTLQALLLEPGNAALEAAALQRLQELGPVALLLDADAPGAPPGATPLAASAAFPTLAGQLFGSAGLEAPQMCQKVLEFDAASVPHAARSRRSLERYVLGATGFRGRSLGAGAAPATAVALPAADDGPDEEAGEADTAQHAGPAGDAMLPAGSTSEGPVLVSILLPANASGGSSANASGGHKLSAVDKVFVVLLHPAERYTTYSCALPRPVVL
uniref:BZIP transcription factor 4 n=1 Tax=Chlorella sp. HS2 TaxID=2675547 RepID=A0A8E4MM30_9CHLO|nr:bZIP transcription factor 4 [Chlorella sp. HS2]